MNPIIKESLSDLPLDRWGYAMGARFAICDYLADVGGDTPDTFRQSPLGSNTEDSLYVDLMAERVPVADAEKAERILTRYCAYLERIGASY